MQNFTCCWWLAVRQRTKLKQKGDKCIKVKSFVLQAVRNNCIDIEPAKKKKERKIDQQIICAKTNKVAE